MSAYIFDKLISNYQFNIPPEILNKFFSKRRKNTKLKNNQSFGLYIHILDEYVCNGGCCYLRTKEAAKKIGISIQTFYNWLNQLKEEGLISPFYNEKTHEWEIQITDDFFMKLLYEKDKDSVKIKKQKPTTNIKNNLTTQQLTNHTNTTPKYSETNEKGKNIKTIDNNENNSSNENSYYSYSSMFDHSKKQLQEFEKGTKILLVSPCQSRMDINFYNEESKDIIVGLIKRYESFANDFIRHFSKRNCEVISPIKKALAGNKNSLEKKIELLNKINFLDDKLLSKADVIYISNLENSKYLKYKDIEILIYKAKALNKKIYFDLTPVEYIQLIFDNPNFDNPNNLIET